MNHEPVASAGTITALIEAGLFMLVSLGVLDIDDNQMHAILTFAAAIAGVVGPIWWARQQVTPLSQPRDEDGSPLVRRADGGPTRAQTRAAQGGK